MDPAVKEIINNSGSLRECIDADLLFDATTKITSINFIALERIRYLHIIGYESFENVRLLLDAGASPGYYLAEDGTWLLALCPPESVIPDCLSRCGAALEVLDMRFTRESGIDLQAFPGLKELNLSRNSMLHRIGGLSGLTGLQILNIGDTCFGPVLDIDSNRNLTELTIARTPVRQVRLLHDLPFMRRFNAFRAQIRDMDFLVHFPNMTYLNLEQNPFEQLPPFSNYPGLTYLNLSKTQIRDISTLRCLHDLETLGLSNVPICALDDDVFPENLVNLNLWAMKIDRLPEGIRRLRKLRVLFLVHLNLKELPDWLPELGLTIGRDFNSDIVLADTTVRDIDDMSIFDQPQEMILQWFESRAKAKPLNEMKIVFLGDGSAGKTLTISRLLLDGEHPEDFDGCSTPGIVITDKTYPIDGRNIQVHFWDFGGQEILHSMHRMFLTNRTLYVVVLNVRDGTQDERARYWLHNIRSFAKNAPVLLVLNQMDQNENASINESDLRAMYPNLGDVVKMSAKTDSPEYFRANFLRTLKRRISNFESLGSPFLPAWGRLKKKLQHMDRSYIRGQEYIRLCEECGVGAQQEIRLALLNWFNDLGVSFCYGGSAKLEDYVILRPDWITNAIYMILFNRIPEVRNGLVSHDTIYRLLRDPSDRIRRVLPHVVYTTEEVEYVLNVIRRFRLSFMVDEDQEFIPMLCDSNSLPVSVVYEKDPHTLEFRMEYEYLPNNVLHRLMVELRADLDKEHVWLTGARFCQSSSGLSAVVKSEGNLLRIFVRAAKEWYTPDYYLYQIKDAVDRINRAMGLSVRVCHVAYKADGITELFDYDDLLFAQQCGDTEVRSRARQCRISIRDILRQSAHIVDAERERLLQRIIRACEKVQDNRDFWHTPEDNRTTYIRDLLSEHYVVLDQTRGGRSELGPNAGELDLVIRRDPRIPWTILEALNLRGQGDSQITYWNRHLKKLLENYNSPGLPFLFHVSYVSCARGRFNSLCSTYFSHMRFYSPAPFILQSCAPLKTSRDEYEANHFLQAAACVYDCGGYPTTVYHIFVRIGE